MAGMNRRNFLKSCLATLGIAATGNVLELVKPAIDSGLSIQGPFVADTIFAKTAGGMARLSAFMTVPGHGTVHLAFTQVADSWLWRVPLIIPDGHSLHLKWEADPGVITSVSVIGSDWHPEAMGPPCIISTFSDNRIPLRIGQ